ncbi:putative protein N(5)-glutamine methyltransferase [Rhodococcus aerolatus]
MTPAEVVDRLRRAGCVFAEDEAALLVEAARGGAGLEALVARRVAGEPLEPLLGWAAFDGLRVPVAPGVFVPRRRTRWLVREAVRLAPHARLVVDLCCGSAAVALALAARLPSARVHAADVDPAAVACARRSLPAADVHLGDLYAALPDALRGRVDVLAVNAPYVPTDAIALMPPEARDHEARVALDGGPDGTDVQRRVAAGAPEWLSPTGVLLVETGADQAVRTADLVTAAGLHAVTTRSEDLDGTVVLGTRR